MDTKTAAGTAAGALRPRHVAAVAAGNALEFYDFLTYGFFAPQIGRAFFPSKNHTTELLVALATFGVGFLMRPVGAAAIGMIADKVGRKPAMLLALMLMGATMLGMALIPPAAQIGAWAGFLAVACRMIQGFALGGQVGPATSYLVEAAPPNRRGFFVSLQFVSQQLAIIVSGVVGFTLAHSLSEAALGSWGWRVAFLVGLVIVPFGLFLRRGLEESLPAEPRAQATAPATPKGFGVTAVLGLLLLAGGTTVNYLGNYTTTYATQTLHLSSVVGFTSTILVGVGGLIGAAVGGWAGDRYSRRALIVWPFALQVLIMIPMFMAVVATRSPAVLWATGAVFTFVNSLYSTNTLVFITERMPAAIRGRSTGLIYAVSISVFGGSTQFIVAGLTALTRSPLAPAWYATGIVALSLVASLFLPKKASEGLSEPTA
ncbi:MAG TPA: MFS transporter [Caulobacteraceae bacterium]|jgi:MFS family permease